MRLLWAPRPVVQGVEHRSDQQRVWDLLAAAG
jgi:hypothetical protein